ncbi:hypothetical protein FHR81_005456 [Actinoalloteichus hoggarensis]|uniref:Uncharacterized protein n=1 Tax=Actinoalloteichus hoggarensis TaxID=1470176 RepID=A0A221VWU4_9PSEU|nr:hypothetical protein AHOG_01515 [Actinoalloteichus hoggarensis]MBB5924379.1 hypothetical protein [Actinoalloteichus hoggarensis]
MLWSVLQRRTRPGRLSPVRRSPHLRRRGTTAVLSRRVPRTVLPLLIRVPPHMRLRHGRRPARPGRPLLGGLVRSAPVLTGRGVRCGGGTRLPVRRLGAADRVGPAHRTRPFSSAAGWLSSGVLSGCERRAACGALRGVRTLLRPTRGTHRLLPRLTWADGRGPRLPALVLPPHPLLSGSLLLPRRLPTGSLPAR